MNIDLWLYARFSRFLLYRKVSIRKRASIQFNELDPIAFMRIVLLRKL